MAHFAQVENGFVTRVIVVANEDCNGGDFPDSEPIGQAFIVLLGISGDWLQTSYHNNFRGLYASGKIFDGTNFVAPEPIKP